MKLTVLVLILAIVCGVTVGQEDWTINCPECRGKVELGLILDSSRSISRDDFSDVKNFLQDFVKNFIIGSDAIRISLITYGEKVHTEDSFNLTTYRKIEDIVQAVQAIDHHLGGYTATGEAIKYMREKQLASEYVRRGVKKVSIVFTDGNSQSRTFTANEAKRARDQGIRMYAIGITQNIDLQELTDIAGNNGRVNRVDSYNKLTTIKEWLVKEACESNSSQ